MDKNLRNIISIVLLSAVVIGAVSIVIIKLMPKKSDNNKELAESGESFVSVGIIQTSDSKEETTINYLDDKLNEVLKADYSYSNLFMGSYKNTCKAGDEMYILQGNPGGMDGSKVIALNTENGKLKEYSINRPNVISVDADSDYIYALSNLNMSSSADRISKQDGSVTSVLSEDYILDGVVDVGGKVYSFAYSMSDYFLCEIDFEKGSVEVLEKIKCTDPPSFLTPYGDSLLYVCDGKLNMYKTEDGSSTQIKLSSNNAFNINVSGDYVYVGYTNIYSKEDNSRVEVYDMKSGQVVKELESNGAILQIEPVGTDNQKLYIGSYDEVMEYDIKGEKGKLVHSYKYKVDDIFLPGGFFVIDKDLKVDKPGDPEIITVKATEGAVASGETSGEVSENISEDEMERARIEAAKKMGMTEEDLKAYDEWVEEIGRKTAEGMQ